MSNFQKSLSLAAVILLTGCATLVRETPPELACEGPITAGTTRADLVARFGPANVSEEEIDIGEGETVPGTVIYADEPSRRVEVIWVNPETRTSVASVRISEPSDWLVGGLSTGQSLEEVARINDRPFSLYGFEWDYAGTIASWNGGSLDWNGGCRLLARFQPSDESSEGALAGEELFASNDPRMREMNPTIYELLLIFD